MSDIDLKCTLMAFSEWLDSEGLIKPDTGKDKRTHEELASEFIGDGAPTTRRAEQIAAELDHWGRGLIAEAEKATCAHGPTVESKYVGRLLLEYAERIRAAREGV